MTKDLPFIIEPYSIDCMWYYYFYIDIKYFTKVPELQGEPEDVCREKCKIAYSKVNKPCIVEDTCLCFNVLKGLPGVYMFVINFFNYLLFLHLENGFFKK